MWKRKDDVDDMQVYDDEEGGRKRSRTRCGMIVCGVCLLVLAAIALLVFFLFPRIPTVQQQGVDVRKFQISSTAMTMDATVHVSVYNPNYVSLTLESVKLNITHEGDFLGTVNDTNINFPSRQNKTIGIDVSFVCNDPAAIYSMNQELVTSGYVTLRFKGPVKVAYLGVSIQRDVDITKQISPTGKK